MGRHHRQRAVRVEILCSQEKHSMYEHASTNRPLSPRDLEDTALIALVASGDRVAFEKLYLAYHKRISRFLARFIRSRENREEIIDDTFMVVWRTAGQFRHTSRLSTCIM